MVPGVEGKGVLFGLRKHIYLGMGKTGCASKPLSSDNPLFRQQEDIHEKLFRDVKKIQKKVNYPHYLVFYF